MDHFWVISITRVLVDEFYFILAQKYRVKRMGRPVDFLGRTISHRMDVAILIYQPALVQTTIDNADMNDANGRCTSYNTIE